MFLPRTGVSGHQFQLSIVWWYWWLFTGIDVHYESLISYLGSHCSSSIFGKSLYSCDLERASLQDRSSGYCIDSLVVGTYWAFEFGGSWARIFLGFRKERWRLYLPSFPYHRSYLPPTNVLSFFIKLRQRQKKHSRSLPLTDPSLNDDRKFYTFLFGQRQKMNTANVLFERRQRRLSPGFDFNLPHPAYAAPDPIHTHTEPFPAYTEPSLCPSCKTNSPISSEPREGVNPPSAPDYQW